MSGKKRMTKVRFEAELIEGHKGVTPVIVPFDPEEQWRSPPVRLDPRRVGWLVNGRANGTRFEGYIGVRWGRFFLTIDAELRATLDVNVGDVLSMVVEPTVSASALAKAREQCKVTTAPKRGRTDAIVLPEKKRAARP